MRRIPFLNLLRNFRFRLILFLKPRTIHCICEDAVRAYWGEVFVEEEFFGEMLAKAAEGDFSGRVGRIARNGSEDGD